LLIVIIYTCLLRPAESCCRPSQSTQKFLNRSGANSV